MSSAAETAEKWGRTAVSMGSGFLGVYAHAGFLNALEDRGISPVRYAGTSAGALAGALRASGLKGAALKEAALSRDLMWAFADWGALWRLPGVLTSFWASGVFSGKRLVAHLRERLGDLDLRDLPLEVAVTEVDGLSLDLRHDGPLAEWVMASCAVPALFEIQRVGGNRYLDGGIVCELPFEQWLDDPEIDTIVLHRLTSEEGSGPAVRWETVATSVGRAHRSICAAFHEYRMERARRSGKRVIEVRSEIPFPGFFGREKPLKCYELGYTAGWQVVDAGD